VIIRVIRVKALTSIKGNNFLHRQRTGNGHNRRRLQDWTGKCFPGTKGYERNSKDAAGI